MIDSVVISKSISALTAEIQQQPGAKGMKMGREAGSRSKWAWDELAPASSTRFSSTWRND
ncbi:MAG: hypothetical protein EA419_04290 [Wenzhouxiangella sp.]|nr:MAG: hypothetical protein EA419_04290 [Wenzhouxiangella sp.]